MTQFTLSARDRRTLVMGAAVIVTVLIIMRGLPALVDWNRMTTRTTNEVIGELHHAQLSINAIRIMRDTLRLRTGRLKLMAPRIFLGSNTSATAALASWVGDVADENRVRLGSVRFSSDTTSRALVYVISMRFDATGDVVGLAGILKAMEQGPQIFSVRELSITQPEPAAPNDRPEALRINVVLDALAIRELPRS